MVARSRLARTLRSLRRFATVEIVQANTAGSEEGIAYRVDRSDTIVWLSDSWQTFALANDWQTPDDVLGTSIWESITGRETTLIWRELLARARQGVPINVPFRCDSPGTRRFLQLSITPGNRGEIDFRSTTLGLVEREPLALVSAHYGPDENIRCCSWCKRFDTDGWVEVEEAVARLGLLEHESRPVTHVMCPDCEVSVRRDAGL